MTAEEKIQELFDDEALLDRIFEAKDPDELMKIFAENNVTFEDVTKEEVFDAFQRAKTGELSEEELENVSGGFYVALKTAGIYFAYSGSLCAAGGLALIGLAAYAGYRYIKKKIR